MNRIVVCSVILLGVKPSKESGTIGAQRDNEVGNTRAGEILGVLPSNVRKMLKRYGVEGRVVKQGKRDVHVYPEDKVEAVRDQRVKHGRLARKG